MTIKDSSLSANGYQWLPLAISQLGNWMFQAYFEVFCSLLVEGSL